MKPIRVVGLMLVGVLVAAGCSATGDAATPSTTRLSGLFKLSPGKCTSASTKPEGSYLIIVAAAANHAVRNPRSACLNKDYTLLQPGSAGGLVTGQFQPQPKPAFDAHRDSRADSIVEPTRFGPFKFGFATEARDEQDAPTGAPAFPAPQATLSNGTLDMDLRSLVVSFAGPAGGTCAKSFGLGCWQLGSKSASGTYDVSTRHFVLDWFSGESFTPNGDSTEVHLEGTFESAGSVAVASSQEVSLIPAALREVAVAASDLSHGRISPRAAKAVIERAAPLAALSNAMTSPAEVISGLSSDSVTQIQSTVARLQEIEGDILPAVRIVVLRGGRQLAAAAALTEVEHDPRVPELGQLLGTWQQIYGGLLALEQQAAE